MASSQATRMLPGTTTFARSRHRRTHRPFAAAVLLIGCVLASVVSGESGEAEFDVTIDADHGDPFDFWTITTVASDVNGASSASLRTVTCTVVSPPGATLGFLEGLEGFAQVDEQLTKVVSLAPVACHGTSAQLTIDYPGDMRPFFPDGHTLTVAWLAYLNTAYPMPKTGITVHCDIAVKYTL